LVTETLDKGHFITAKLDDLVLSLTLILNHAEVLYISIFNVLSNALPYCGILQSGYILNLDDSTIVEVFTVGADQHLLFTAHKYLFIVRLKTILSILREEITFFELEKCLFPFINNLWSLLWYHSWLLSECWIELQVLEMRFRDIELASISS
jgi:hypothetical protein